MRECNLMLNFQVYRRLLCHHSSLFDKLLGAQPEHALIDLTCEAHTFRLFFRWLNTGSLADYGFPSWPDVVDLYLFAEQFGVPALQNHTLDMSIRKYAEKNEVPANAGDCVYQATSPEDPFRRLLIHLVAERWSFELSSSETELPAAFWHDLVNHMRAQGSVPGDLSIPRKDWVRSECKTFCARFHVHHELEDGSETCNE